jgi:hypothetical protein
MRRNTAASSASSDAAGTGAVQEGENGLKKRCTQRSMHIASARAPRQPRWLLLLRDAAPGACARERATAAAAARRACGAAALRGCYLSRFVQGGRRLDFNDGRSSADATQTHGPRYSLAPLPLLRSHTANRMLVFAVRRHGPQFVVAGNVCTQLFSG